MDKVSLVTLLIPITYAISFIEAIIISLALRQDYDWKAACANWATGIGKSIVYLFPYAFYIPIFAWVAKNQVFELSLTNENNFKNILLVLALLLGQDFCYYWSHRISHHVRWLWANHIVHHSSAQLNLSAAFRNGWLTKFNGTYLFLIPLVWLGFSPWLILSVLFLNVYQFIIHNTWTPRLGWLEYIINTPSSHRVHHAKNEEYINANFGGVLIIFDIIFGTYVPESKDNPCKYGVENRDTNYNPISIQLLEWKHFFRDVRKLKNITSIAKYAFKSPNWIPNENTTNHEIVKEFENSKVS